MGPDIGGTSWRKTVKTRQKKRACTDQLLENGVQERLADNFSIMFSRSLAPDPETNLPASSVEKAKVFPEVRKKMYLYHCTGL